MYVHDDCRSKVIKRIDGIRLIIIVSRVCDLYEMNRDPESRDRTKCAPVDFGRNKYTC